MLHRTLVFIFIYIDHPFFNTPHDEYLDDNKGLLSAEEYGNKLRKYRVQVIIHVPSYPCAIGRAYKCGLCNVAPILLADGDLLCDVQKYRTD
jgi:hypothetical protein